MDRKNGSLKNQPRQCPVPAGAVLIKPRRLLIPIFAPLLNHTPQGLLHGMCSSPCFVSQRYFLCFTGFFFRTL